MKTLESQLLEYGAFHEREQGDLLLDEVGILVTTRPPSRSRNQRPWLIAAAAVVSVLVVIGGFGLLTRIQNDTDESPVVNQIEPEESPVVDQFEPEEPPVVGQEEPESSPSTTLPPEAVEPSATITGLAWQQVIPDGIAPTTDSGMTALVSGGDRFLYVDVPNNTVGTSFDGSNWTRESIQGSLDRSIGTFVGWRDTVVGFGCGGWVGLVGEPMTAQPGCVSVIHADGTVANQSFDAQINAAGIGPFGIVAIVTDSYDEDGLEYLAENDLATGLTGRDWADFDGSVIEIVDGVLHIEFRDGLVSDYVLADHGYADAESQVASGWFSQDGEEWIPIPDFPSKTNPDGMGWGLIGTEDGFVAISDDNDGGVLIWHSSNGLDWRELGQSPGGGTDLSRWSDGAIVAGAENNFWYVSGLGIAETPLATTGLGEISISISDKVGVVIVDMGATMELSQVLYSPDGQEWTNTNVPPEMRESLANLGWPMHQAPIEVAATETGVLLRLSVGGVGQGNSTSVWFLGTPITD